MVTIKDVAKAAGVSISTASYALNDSEKVSKATKEKVLRIAQELDYRPNGSARNLKIQRTDLIGLFVHDINGPFYNELVKGIQEVAALNNYQLAIFCDSSNKGNPAYKFMRERRVDGAIIISSKVKDEEILNLAKNGMPIVVLDRELNVDNVCSVLVDNEKGAYEAVSHLVKIGYKKIAFFSGPEDSYDSIKRFSGYMKTLKTYGIDFNENLIIKGKFTEQSGYEAMNEFIKEHKSIPEAIFSSNDEMAIGAIRALKENGYKIPEDIAIIGFDDIIISSYVQPNLTTVKSPMYELGLLSTHALFNLLNGKAKNNSLTLSTELIIRESCGKQLDK